MARTSEFQTIRSEGGLLPPDLLRRVLDPRAKLDGTSPEAYGLPAGERLNEVITQSWNRLCRHWAEFKANADNLPEGEAATGLTNDKWTLPLLRELGFGTLPTSAAPEIDGRSYPIARFHGPVPLHLVGCGLSLDRRTAGARGAAAANPHGMVQEFLNRSEGHLWAILSNGCQLRILRDNQALSRQSFIEFDLEAMFGGQVYPDFVLMWMVAHVSRFLPREGDKAESCLLERWTKIADEEGTRALGELRGSVAKALQVLGAGLTSHPHNSALQAALSTNQLAPAELHAELLRVVYRLIFLFVAEDRQIEGQPLLHPQDRSDKARLARERYAAHYGTARLRELAGNIRGSRHGDLWRQFKLLARLLSDDQTLDGARGALALPVLGGFLWGESATPHLSDAELTNHDFLEVLRHLAYTRQGKALRSVDFRNLGAEELGGVYETLLELTPQVSGGGRKFEFAEFAGNERKTSGSYYTPDSLVQCLLDTALDPVVNEAIAGKAPREAEAAILNLKICDPAVGSGHFLVGAAHRLARYLARARSLAEGESEPSPLHYQHALRDVIGRCLYGVDINPMSAELCRVSLWLEAMEPGKPLSFLDHHIRVGNSLLGATLELITAGLPDEAFTAIEGDDKAACSELKKLNKGARKSAGPLFAAPHAERVSRLAKAAANVAEMPDDRPEDIRAKERAHRLNEETAEFRRAKLIADAWCAAFVYEKKMLPTPAGSVGKARASGIVQTHILDLGDGRDLDADYQAGIERLATQYKFFHWHLVFPEVFERGGFDCVLGNPPWERVELQEREWFAERNPDIAQAPNSAARKRMIADLMNSDPAQYQSYQSELRRAQGESQFLRVSNRYPLCGRGKINLYTIFVESMRQLVHERGRAGCVLPSGVATDDTTKYFFQNVVETKSLVSLFDFENRKGLFPDVDSRMKFCLFTCGSGVQPLAEQAEFVFFAHGIEDLNDAERRFTLSAADIELVNPNTRTCPIFRTRADAELTKAIYRRVPVFVREARGGQPEVNPWGIKLATMFNMSTDSHLFRTLEELEGEGWNLEGNVFRRDDEEYWPLYEQNLIHLNNHRYASFRHDDETVSDRKSIVLREERLQNPFDSPIPRYWVPRSRVVTNAPPAMCSAGYAIAFRRSVRSTDSRTALFCALPFCGAGDSIFLVSPPASQPAVLLAILSSLIFDYAARQCIGGENASFFAVKQLPVLEPRLQLEPSRPNFADFLSAPWVTERVLELTYTSWDMAAFGRACGWPGPPLRWCDARRFLLRCELDAALFHLYLPSSESGEWVSHDSSSVDAEYNLRKVFATPREAVAHVLDSFPLIRKQDQLAHSGDFRTKRAILEIYDEMKRAKVDGREYRSRLDPRPCDQSCLHDAL